MNIKDKQLEKYTISKENPVEVQDQNYAGIEISRDMENKSLLTALIFKPVPIVGEK